MHEPYLLAALDQAKLGRGFCAPNPSVGAVAVHNGAIIARARHRGAGTPHAEQLLIDQLPEKLSGVTLYVTLEPCNHWGRTPPCVNAIIHYGIEKVVYAYRDPNPLIAANNTPKLLQEQGIEVKHIPLAEVDVFYESYRYWTRTNKPWITVKLAQTLDGKIAGVNGERVQLSNEACAQFTHQKRQHSDVILTTARTINQDDPQLNVRFNKEAIGKPIAILDRQGRLNPHATVFSTATNCHVYFDEKNQLPLRHPDCSYHAIPASSAKLDLNRVIHHLGSLGYHDVWVEAGGRLFTELHRQGLVNRTYLYLVPSMLGDKATALYTHPERFNQPHAVRWQPMDDNMIISLDWASDAKEALCSPA